MRNLYLSGRFYDWLIEPLVFSLKVKVERLFKQMDLFPALDICCGTGTQLHLLQSGEAKLIGLDISLSGLTYASHKYPRIPFVCADAASLPFKEVSIKGILISFSLHDKSPRIRDELMNEAKRLLKPGGRIIFVDFEQHWSLKSRVGSVFVYIIERLAGSEHFRNNRQFLRAGGLRAFVQKHDLIEIKRYDVEWGALAVVVAESRNSDAGC